MTQTTSPNEQHPRVGLGVIILKNEKVLLGYRTTKNGQGTWSPPGGHLEFNEELDECARRETMEECGVKIKNVRHGPYINGTNNPEGKHYLTVYILADWDSGEPQITEPDKHPEWHWFDWDAMPSPLFHPFQLLVDTGFRPK